VRPSGAALACRYHRPMQAIILADGDVAARTRLDAAWPGWERSDAVVIAADGGARHAASLGLTIDLWVGDGDSLGDEGLAGLAAAGVPMEQAPVDKDESDTELAVRAALHRGADALTLVGVLGGPRLDHALANLGLLALPELEGRETVLLAADARVRQLQAASDGGPARAILDGRVGDLVSLLPVGADAEGVTTDGLRYPLRDEVLRVGRTRGLSNLRTAATASVTLRSGRLLVVETPATL
jgi:thiamine pyrophosphokinase